MPRPLNSLNPAMEQIRAIYAEIDQRPTNRDCQLRTECCQFHITGQIPQVTRGEAYLLAQGLRAAGRTRLPDSETGDCPLLHPRTGKCLLYALRPFGCRTHFCEPAGGPYKRAEVIELIRKIDKIDKALGGDGPHDLLSALKIALQESLVKNKRS